MRSSRLTYPHITRREAHELAAARRALKAISERAERAAWRDEELASRLGRLAGTAAIAEDVLFDVLNIAQSYLDCTAAEDAIDRALGKPTRRQRERLELVGEEV